MKITFIILSLIYVLICAVAYVIQGRFIFLPDSEDAGTPDDAGLAYDDVTFTTSGGGKRHGWFIPTEGATYTLLYCHGNAGNISHRLETIKQFASYGLSIFIFDYAGYGKSEGRPGERATSEDANAAWHWLTKEKKIPADRIIVHGRSLGSGVAVQLASRVRAAGLILESAFTSVPELATRSYPWLPVKFLVKHRYNSYAKIDTVRGPKLFVHSLHDEVIPYGMGRRLYNKASRPKTFVRVRDMGHNEAYLVSGSAYEKALIEFLGELGGRR